MDSSHLTYEYTKEIQSQQKINEGSLIEILKGIASKTDLISDDFWCLSEIFDTLGKSYTKKGKMEQNLEHYTNAAKFFQYTLSTRKKWQININDDVYYQLYTIKKELLIAINTNSELARFPEVCVEDESKGDKAMLKEMRGKLKNLTNITEAETLFEGISKGIISFMSTIIWESEKMIGKPPCKYAVIGLGSLALQQATPYSDLEFAILTENNQYQGNANPLIKNYFTNLSHLIHFRIINLGETVIPKDLFKINLDRFITRGFNFDLGGHTPLGRKDKEYSLIQTPEGMVRYVQDDQDHWTHTDKLLPYILQTCVYMCGENSLVKGYLDKVQQYLCATNTKGIKNREARAIKRLKEGVEEYNYLNIPGKPFVTHVQGDLERYDLPSQMIGVEVEGRFFDVKQEVYRLADRWLYDLALYHGIILGVTPEVENLWQAIKMLSIPPEGKQHLLDAISFATILRPKAYTHCWAQE